MDPEQDALNRSPIAAVNTGADVIVGGAGKDDETYLTFWTGMARCWDSGARHRLLLPLLGASAFMPPSGLVMDEAPARLPSPAFALAQLTRRTA